MLLLGIGGVEGVPPIFGIDEEMAEYGNHAVSAMDAADLPCQDPLVVAR